MLKTLSAYHTHLFSNDVVNDLSFDEVANVLQRISDDAELAISSKFNLQKRLSDLGGGLTSIMPSVESSLIARNYLNENISKSIRYQ